MRGLDVVAFVRVFINVVVAVGHHDEVGVAAVTDRDVDRSAVGGVAFGGGQGTAVVKLANQQVVAAERGIQRKENLVLPASTGRDGTLVGLPRPYAFPYVQPAVPKVPAPVEDILA